jgi:hypothetical protein
MKANEQHPLEQIATAIKVVAGAPKELGKRRAMLRTKATQDSRLTRNDLVVFDRLFAFTDLKKNGYCGVRYETIAAGKQRGDKPVSRRAVAYSLERLEKHGYIVSQQQRWRGVQATNRYSFPELVPECKPECKAECRPKCNPERTLFALTRRSCSRKNK